MPVPHAVLMHVVPPRTRSNFLIEVGVLLVRPEPPLRLFDMIRVSSPQSPLLVRVSPHRSQHAVLRDVMIGIRGVPELHPHPYRVLAHVCRRKVVLVSVGPGPVLVGDVEDEAAGDERVEKTRGIKSRSRSRNVSISNPPEPLRAVRCDPPVPEHARPLRKFLVEGREQPIVLMAEVVVILPEDVHFLFLLLRDREGEVYERVAVAPGRESARRDEERHRDATAMSLLQSRLP